MWTLVVELVELKSFGAFSRNRQPAVSSSSGAMVLSDWGTAAQTSLIYWRSTCLIAPPQ